MSYNLNRIKHFEHIISFPKVVLKALVHTCGANVTDDQIENREKEIIKFVKNYKSYISEDFENIETKADFMKIATYIGSLSGWKDKESLLKSLKDIIVFNDSLDIDSIISKYGELKIAYKKNDKIYSLDVLMAYKFCLEKGIDIDDDDTFKNIEKKINDYLESKKLINSIDINENDTGGEISNCNIINVNQNIEGGENSLSEKNTLNQNIEGGEILKLKENNNLNQNSIGGENSLSENNNLNQNIEKGEILKLKEIIKNLEESKSSYIEIIKNKDESLENDKNIQESLNIKIRNLENDKESLSMKYKNEKDLLNEKIRNLESDNSIQESLNIKIKNLENDKESLNIKIKNLENDKDIQKEVIIEEKDLDSSHSKIYNNFLQNKNLTVDNDKLEECLNKSILNLLISKSLLDKEECLFVALRIYNFDLRDSPDIFEDLMGLNNAKKEKLDYYPDKERKDIFARNISLNKNYYSIVHYYSKDLKKFYNNKNLESLYIEYNVKDLESLEKIYKTNNFHRGWLQGDIMSFYEQENLKNASQYKILSFGIPGKRMVNFSVNELRDFLQNKGNIDPITKEILNTEQLERLKDICEQFKDFKEYNQLLESINDKKLIENTNIKTFIEKYIFASDLVDRVLDHLFRIGMFIRGWRIKNNSVYVYPLAKKDCVIYPDKKEVIDSNVKRVLGDFNIDLEKIQDIGIKNNLKRLPIVKYVDKDFVYDNSYNNILELLNNLENMEKDILKISNLLILTSYYYTNISSGKKLLPLDSFETL